MKKFMIFMLIYPLLLGLHAQSNDQAQAASAKAINYKEVLNSIDYPKATKESGIEGRIIVTLWIDDEGKLSKYTLADSPCRKITKVVENVIPDLRFSPAQNTDGKFIASKMVVPISFRLTI